MFAIIFHWTPQQIQDLDPDYVIELKAKINADNEIARQQVEKQNKAIEEAKRR
jgi:hypothetical protein